MTATALLYQSERRHNVFKLVFLNKLKIAGWDMKVSLSLVANHQPGSLKFIFFALNAYTTSGGWIFTWIADVPFFLINLAQIGWRILVACFNQASWEADPADMRIVIVSLAVTSHTKSNSLLISVRPVFVLPKAIRISFRRVKSGVTCYLSGSFADESLFILVDWAVSHQ